MTLISSKKVKARKEHRCDWCYLPIQVGETYDYSFNSFDGEAFTWKNHLFCMTVAQKLKMWDDCCYDEGLTDTDFQESIYWAYKDIMLEKDKNAFADRDYELPDFREQLQVVLDSLGIPHSLSQAS